MPLMENIHIQAHTNSLDSWHTAPSTECNVTKIGTNRACAGALQQIINCYAISGDIRIFFIRGTAAPADCGRNRHQPCMCRSTTTNVSTIHPWHKKASNKCSKISADPASVGGTKRASAAARQQAIHNYAINGN